MSGESSSTPAPFIYLFFAPPPLSGGPFLFSLLFINFSNYYFFLGQNICAVAACLHISCGRIRCEIRTITTSEAKNSSTALLNVREDRVGAGVSSKATALLSFSRGYIFSMALQFEKGDLVHVLSDGISAAFDGKVRPSATVPAHATITLAHRQCYPCCAVMFTLAQCSSVLGVPGTRQCTELSTNREQRVSAPAPHGANLRRF